MFDNTTQLAEHIARRARLGVYEARPVYRAPRPPEPPAPPKTRIVYTMVPVYPEPIGPIDPLDESAVAINGRWKMIVREVCEKHRVTIHEIRAHTKETRIVIARQEAMYRLKKETLMSYPQIAAKMGGFDHTTCMSAVKKHTARLAALVGMRK